MTSLWVVFLIYLVRTEAKPHMVVFVADELGWNDIGYHNSDMHTPNLDNLAANGVILNYSYVQPSGVQTRSAFMTGLLPYHMGMQHSGIRPLQPKYLPLDYTLLPEKLKDLGYATHAVGKWHLGMCAWEYTPTYRGFDSFFGFYHGMQDHYTHEYWGGYDFRFNETVYSAANGTYSTFLSRDRAIDILANADPNTPLFLYVAFQAPKQPLQVPNQYLSNCAGTADQNRKTYCEENVTRDCFQNICVPGEAMVAAMDEAIGDIKTAMSDHGFLDNAVIVFTTDNGAGIKSFANNLPLRGSKATLWEGGTRGVSFIYSANSSLVQQGVVENGLFHAADWFPTLLSFAGAAPAAGTVDGLDQTNMISLGYPSSRLNVVYNIDNLGERAAIRTERFKLIEGNPGSKYHGWIPLPPDFYSYTDITDFPENQLFDLIDDPNETTDIAEIYPGVVSQMKDLLDLLRQDMVPAVAVPDDKAGKPKKFGGYWTPGWC